MKEADINVLSKEVVEKCEQLCIEINMLNGSKRNELAFTSNDHKNREFEAVFLLNKYRICTRYTGYRNVMVKETGNVLTKVDADYRRKSFYVETDDVNELNHILLAMLMHGYDNEHKIELID